MKLCGVVLLFAIVDGASAFTFSGFFVKPTEKPTKKPGTVPVFFVRKKTTEKPGTVPMFYVIECPSGWTKRRSDDKCFKVFPEAMSYREAKSTCSVNRAELTKVTDAKMADFLADLAGIPDRMYIGVRDDFRNCSYRYQDGTEMNDYHPWTTDFYQKTDHCVQMDKDGSWTKVHCGTKLPFVCEREIHLKKSYSMACPEGWTSYDREGKCLKAFDGEKNWEEARDECRTKNADLVQLHDESKADVVYELNTGKPFTIIGLQNKNVHWSSLDGTVVLSKEWSYGGSSCGHLYHDDDTDYFTFRRMGCETKAPFVCEMNA